jgi:hypothetical protein
MGREIKKNACLRRKEKARGKCQGKGKQNLQTSTEAEEAVIEKKKDGRATRGSSIRARGAPSQEETTQNDHRHQRWRTRGHQGSSARP